MLAFVCLTWLGSGAATLYLYIRHTQPPPKKQNERATSSYSELNRVIHEPGRLMIIALLAVVKECDFLYLLHETEMNKGQPLQPSRTIGGGPLRRD